MSSLSKIETWSMTVIEEVLAMVWYLLWCLKDRRPWGRPMTHDKYLHVQLCGKKNILSYWAMCFSFQCHCDKWICDRGDGGTKQCILGGEMWNHVDTRDLSYLERPCWCTWPVLWPEVMLLSVVHSPNMWAMFLFMLMSVAICGPCGCLWSVFLPNPCWCPWDMMLLKASHQRQHLGEQSLHIIGEV